jgi:tRNA U55 pseudouridine synthase TruB
LSKLVRTEASGIQLGECLSLDELQTAIEAGTGSFAQLLIPPEKLALGLPVWQSVEHDCCARLRNGQQISVSASLWLENLKTPVPAQSGTTGVMLIDTEGSAFGVGEARLTEGGRILITMKRGLA